MKMKLFLLTILSTQALFGAAASAADRGPIDAAITDVALALPRRTVQDVLDEEGIKPDSKLERLDFDLKGITDIVPGKFAYFSELKILDLSYNKITNIPEGAFAGLKKLEELEFYCNFDLKDIAPNAFHGMRRSAIVNIYSSQHTNLIAHEVKERIKVALYCSRDDLFKVDDFKIDDINPRPLDPHFYPKPVTYKQFFKACMKKYIDRHPELYEEPFDVYWAALCKDTPG